ncbi:MAG: DUF357 domain-containing protein [Nanoarchaeota archaeon]
MNNIVTEEKLKKYFAVTKEALEKAKNAVDSSRREQAEDFLDMASRYYQDANYFFFEKKDAVLAFAAINYAHGWLDAGARAGFFKVKDSQLFTVDS